MGRKPEYILNPGQYSYPFLFKAITTISALHVTPADIFPATIQQFMQCFEQSCHEPKFWRLLAANRDGETGNSACENDIATLDLFPWRGRNSILPEDYSESTVFVEGKPQSCESDLPFPDILFPLHMPHLKPKLTSNISLQISHLFLSSLHAPGKMERFTREGNTNSPTHPLFKIAKAVYLVR